MSLRSLARAALACLVLAGPAALAPAHAEVGKASFYGYETSRRGALRADGYAFDPEEIMAAHWTLPLCRRRAREARRCHPTRVRVEDLATGRSIVVPILDRGPHPRLHRMIDLSIGAARQLGITQRGVVRARMTVLP